MTNQSLTEKQIAKEIRSATLKGHCYLIRGAGTDKARIFDAKTQAGKLRVRVLGSWISPSAGVQIALHAGDPRETIITLAHAGGSYV
jgi:hypothetical protein